MGGSANTNPGAVPEESKRARDEDESCDTATGLVDFATFMRVDLRVGTVIAAEWVPKSDKLLKLLVSFGDLGERTILAGIAKSYTCMKALPEKQRLTPICRAADRFFRQRTTNRCVGFM